MILTRFTVLPLVWFFLHPFAKPLFEEQWAVRFLLSLCLAHFILIPSQPYACLTCLRLRLPCVVNLGAFVGCYACKRRNQKCSLTPRVHGVKMTSLRGSWWIAVMHHVNAILELGTMKGSIGVVPDYGRTDIEIADIPAWALAAAGTIRQEMHARDVSDRWDYMVVNIVPRWPFYAMPHSVLVKLGASRPVRPFWPDIGDNTEAVRTAVRILNDGRNGTLPRLFAVNVQDGYDYQPTTKKLPAPKQLPAPKPKEKKKQATTKEGEENKKGNREDNTQVTSRRGPQRKNKGRSPVPSQTDADEGQHSSSSSSLKYSTDEHKYSSGYRHRTCNIVDRGDARRERYATFSFAHQRPRR